MDGITASSGKLLAGINSNYGDSATLTNIAVTDVDEICETFTGNSNGDEPTSNGTGADGTYCIYDEADISGDSSSGSGSSGSSSAVKSSSTKTSKSSSTKTNKSSSAKATSTSTKKSNKTSSSFSTKATSHSKSQDSEGPKGFFQL